MLSRITAALCGLVLLAGVGTAAYTEGRSAAQMQALPVSTLDSGASGDAGVVVELIERLDQGAVRAPDEEKLVEGAVDGLLEALDDPYAEYYDGEEFAQFNEMLDGEFSGVGMVLEETSDGLTVVTVIEDTPAERAGVEVGERIVSVDGTDVVGKPINNVVDRVKGPEGTDVTLGLAGGSEGEREVTLTRERITVPNLQSERLDDGTGYVKLAQFSSDSAKEVRGAVEALVEAGAPGIVLDLRNNPGGLLPEAINIASIFIEDGPVVSVKEREGEEKVYRARGGALDVPLVVLVNKGSASASEIVAGAVQDAGRGEIVGEPTFGKGTVQTIQRLDSGGGVKFTTAEYFTPSGDSIEDVGVQPDRKVSGDEDEQLQAAQEALQALLTSAGAG